MEDDGEAHVRAAARYMRLASTTLDSTVRAQYLRLRQNCLQLAVASGISMAEALEMEAAELSKDESKT